MALNNLWHHISARRCDWLFLQSRLPRKHASLLSFPSRSRTRTETSIARWLQTPWCIGMGQDEDLPDYASVAVLAAAVGYFCVQSSFLSA